MICLDLSIGFLLVGFTYTFIGGLFFISFPGPKACIDQNFIKNFQSDDLMAIIARFFIFFQMSTIFPLSSFIFRTQFFYVIFKISKYPGFAKVFALNAVMTSLCAMVAILYPKVNFNDL